MEEDVVEEEEEEDDDDDSIDAVVAPSATVGAHAPSSKAKSD